LVLIGCGKPRQSVELVDITKAPVQLIHTVKGVQVEGKFLNIDTGEMYTKVIDATEVQGWYAIHPATFFKLLNSIQRSKIVIIGPESDPFSIVKPIDDNAEIEVCLITLEGNQIPRKVRVIEYQKWVIMHPHMYKRLLESGLSK